MGGALKVRAGLAEVGGDIGGGEGVFGLGELGIGGHALAEFDGEEGLVRFRLGV